MANIIDDFDQMEIDRDFPFPNPGVRSMTKEEKFNIEMRMKLGMRMLEQLGEQHGGIFSRPDDEI